MKKPSEIYARMALIMFALGVALVAAAAAAWSWVAAAIWLGLVSLLFAATAASLSKDAKRKEES